MEGSWVGEGLSLGRVFWWAFSFQIGVSVESGAVGGEEFLAFFECDFSFFDGLLCPDFEASHHLLWVVLHVAEHVGYGFAIDDFVDAVGVVVDGDVYGVDVAEEVVHVAEDFLVGSYEEYADVVWLLVFLAVEG